jgi:hypothetical protein
MSSKYTTTKELVKFHKISSIILMKFVGEFFKPKGMTNHSKRPFFGLEGSLPYIGLLYWDVMVARLQININEVFVPL